MDDWIKNNKKMQKGFIGSQPNTYAEIKNLNLAELLEKTEN